MDDESALARSVRMPKPYAPHNPSVPCPFVDAVRGEPWPIEHHVDPALVHAAASMRDEVGWTDRRPFEGERGPRGSATYYSGGARVARKLRAFPRGARSERESALVHVAWAISGSIE